MIMMMMMMMMMIAPKDSRVIFGGRLEAMKW